MTVQVRSFRGTKVAELKREAGVRQRTRVAFAYPESRQTDYPFVETAVCQWPADHPTHPHELYVPINEGLLRAYQTGHPQISLLKWLLNAIAHEVLLLPFWPEKADQMGRPGLSRQIHWDNAGWQFDEAPDGSQLWLYDPTMPGGEISGACVCWEQREYLNTKVLVVDVPPGVRRRALALVDDRLLAIRQQFVDDWLGGPEQARRLLGL